MTRKKQQVLLTIGQLPVQKKNNHSSPIKEKNIFVPRKNNVQMVYLDTPIERYMNFAASDSDKDILRSAAKTIEKCYISIVKKVLEKYHKKEKEYSVVSTTPTVCYSSNETLSFTLKQLNRFAMLDTKNLIAMRSSLLLQNNERLTVELNKDCLMQIIEHLDFVTAMRLVQTCKSFYCLVRHDSVFGIFSNDFQKLISTTVKDNYQL